MDPDKRWKSIPPIMEDLKVKARKLGLWNLWLSNHYEGGAGFTNLEYGLMCEILGRSVVAREALNCSAPDTGNMEVCDLLWHPGMLPWLIAGSGPCKIRH
jgi:acyl-CoA dehydrogenase